MNPNAGLSEAGVRTITEEYGSRADRSEDIDISP